MDITIKKLNKDLLNDFLHYFNDIAFVDHKEWSNCFCTHFHWGEKEEQLLKEGKVEDGNYAIKLINDGKMQGYMAYETNNVVGWCNANDKVNFSRLIDRKELWDNNERDIKIKSIVCFLIAPEMRGKGIATKILEQICKDAEKNGYKYIEAYPHQNEKNVYMNHYGPYSMYEKAGFKKIKQFEHDCIVRKDLQI
jgi:GNAT superfamily N-acetyltransferase